MVLTVSQKATSLRQTSPPLSNIPGEADIHGMMMTGVLRKELLRTVLLSLDGWREVDRESGGQHNEGQRSEVCKWVQLNLTAEK